MRLVLLFFCSLFVWGRCGGQTSALILPAGVAYDSAGNLYVADARKHQVFELSLAGVTTVVAGTGSQGFGGDGGAAEKAQLDGPVAVAVASNGTIYIADAGNQRVRAVVAGVIATVAGSGVKGFGGDGGVATTARLNGPLAVAVDGSGGLLIADSGNERVRRVFAGVIQTVAGTGVQGFGGDGGAAVTALLDTPAGVAVAGDGRVFVADSHNHRVRVISKDGVMTTFAGTGGRGFGGDGAAAVGAMLFLPRGVAVMPTGEVLFADSDNQRLRMVDASGVIRTVAGSGVQGSSVEGAVGKGAALDTPRGVAVSSFGTGTFGDSRNRVVREVAMDEALYALMGGASHRAVVTLTPAALTYGQGTLGVSVGGDAPVALGNVFLMEGLGVVSTGALAKGSAVLAADMLSAGTHALTAKFEGDVVHGEAVSAAVVVSVAQRAVTATADGVTLVYGGVTPVLTGTVVGVLPRDVIGVGFGTSAGDLAGVGVYPIAAVLTGSANGNYEVVMGAGSGVLEVVKAVPVVTLNAASGYAGVPVTVSAVVGPATRGTPTGVVSFFDGGVAVGSGTIAGGVATVVLNAVPGAHALTASYGGDKNFVGATSAVSSITVGVVPDFTLAVVGVGSQTVVGGTAATYGLAVGAAPGPFSGSVTFSVSGLPKGAVATFTPSRVVPGSGSVAVGLSVQTVALAVRRMETDVRWALVVVLVPFWVRRRRMVGCVAVLVLVGVVGCGERRYPAEVGPAAQTSAVTITGTSTNVVGVVVTHTVSVVLVVQ